MVEHLVNLVSRLGHWGYLIIFLGAMLESAAFLGVIVPGETLVLLGGFLAAQGVLEAGDLTILVCVGAILGDSIGYELGRHFGGPWLLHYGRWVGVRQKHLDRAEDFFRRHGGKAVLIGRFIGFLRALVPFIAGSSRMRYLHFLVYNAIGAILWSITFVALGYFLGASWRVVERWVGRASIILGALVLTVIALTWLWRWLVRHETGIKQRWAMLLERSGIVAFRHRYAPVLNFLQERLTPGGYLGLHVTIGALVIIAATWTFGGIVEDVLTGDPLTIVDRQVAEWLHLHATPPLTRVMIAVTYLASGAVIAPLALLVGLILLFRRRWHRLLALVLTVLGGALLNVVLKHFFRRHRPAFEEPIMTLGTYSFPSGHAIAVVLLYGILALWAVQAARNWRWRILIVLAALFLIVLVDFSRLYLGLHYLSDVLAANVAGVAWLCFCLTGVEALRQARIGPRAAVSPEPG